MFPSGKMRTLLPRRSKFLGVRLMHGSAPASAYHSNSEGTVAQSLPMPRAGSLTAMSWSDLWVLVGSSIYLYLSLFTLRGTPFLLSGDQVFYWMDAEHMMAGGRVCPDLFKLPA